MFQLDVMDYLTEGRNSRLQLWWGLASDAGVMPLA